jgi:Flp pilus assembly protein TadD/predicted Zn-dependent protease with MMP-like domain
MDLRLALLGALAALSGCTCTAAPGGGSAVEPASSGPVTTAPPVRPPFRCVERAAMPATGLVHEAEVALEAGQQERALGCADEALRQEPRSVRALATRGEALSELDRVKEAQLAFSRALAVDPEDPVALAGAADLHVRRLEGAHDALEAGVELALRGLRALTRVPRRDPELKQRLELAAATGLNDLGRAGEALPHAERAVALAPDDTSAQNERGFALFELCRFDEARRAFEQTLRLVAEEPWALHHLGLLAERRGDLAEATRLLARARALAPDDFPPEVAVGPEVFRAEVDRAVAELPAADRLALRDVAVEVADLPELDDLTVGEPPLSPTILGLFRGPPEDEACQPEDGTPCRAIVLYRKNLGRFAHDRAELDRQIRITLTHELGHLRGEDDDELRDRGLQ